MKRYFEVRENDINGMLGFIEKGAPAEFDPIGAMGTAHDCLEHFPGDDGSIDHECMALGCSLWIRGTGGYDFFGAAERAIASEFYTTLWNAYNDDYTLRPRKSNLDLAPLVYYTVDLIKDGIIGEHGEVDSEKLDYFVDSCTYWMQVGFNRAKHRYPNPHTACYLFQQIEEGVDKALAFAHEGQEFEIQYIVSQCRAYVEEVPFKE